MLRSFLLLTLVVSAAAVALFGVSQAADIVLTHQGRLLDATDHPITGAVTLTFRIYDVPTGGVALWTETQPGVPVADGLFTVSLGATTPLALDVLGPPGSNPDRWLGVTVGATELLPRLALGTVPRAASSSRVTGDIVTSPGQLKLGEVDHGVVSMVTSADSAVSDVTQGNLNDPNRVKLRATATDAGVFVSRDGSTTGTIRAAANGGHVALSGHSGSTTGTIRMTASPDSTGSTLASDGDDNGVPESSVSYKTSGPRATGTLSGMSGSTTGTIRMQAKPDSAYSKLEIDANSNGLPERATAMNAGQDELSLVVEYRDGDDPITHKRAGKQSANASGARWLLEDDTDGNGDAECVATTTTTSAGASQSLYRKGLNAVNVRTALVDSVGDAGFIRRIQWDIDNDGTYDMESTTSGDVSGTRSILKGGMSGSTTGTIRMAASPDSAGSSLSSDSDGNGTPESSVNFKTSGPRAGGVLSGMSGSTTGTIRMQASGDSTYELHEMEVGGIASSRTIVTANPASLTRSALHHSLGGATTVTGEVCDDNSASLRAINTKGTGAVVRVAASASDSASLAVSNDEDGNGDPECKAEATSSDKFAQVRGFKVEIAGASRSSFDSHCDSSGASSSLSGRSGSTTATIRMQATPDSTVAIQECDEDNDGHAEARGIIAVKSGSGSGSASSSNRLTCDSDDDGVADVTVEMVADADSACLRLNGLPPGTPVLGTIEMTSSPSGARLAVGAAYCDGTNWVNASDRNSKENFRKVDGEELLDKIAELEITKWNYKNEKHVEHIGPTAQDFREKFGVGSDGKSISTIDPSGIALAAIKELYSQVSQLQKQNKDYEAMLRQREAQIEALQRDFKKLREEVTVKK